MHYIKLVLVQAKCSEVIVSKISKAIKGKSSYFIAVQQLQKKNPVLYCLFVCTFIGHYYLYAVL